MIAATDDPAEPLAGPRLILIDMLGGHSLSREVVHARKARICRFLSNSV